MTASVRSYSVGTDNDPSSVVDKPSGTLEGDLMIIWISLDGGGSSFSCSGWTALYSNLDSDKHSSGLLWKIAGASEPSTYTVTHDDERSQWGVVAIQDHDGIDVNGSDFSDADEANAVCPSVTTTTADTLLLRFASADAGDVTTPHGAVTGYTMTFNAGWFSSASISCQYKTQATAGATGTANVSLSDDQEWTAVTLAILPIGSAPVLYGAEYQLNTFGTFIG